MTPAEYTEAALRTKSSSFYDEIVPRWKAEHVIYDLLSRGDLIDEIKKGLFYGKATPNLDKIVDTGYYSPKAGWKDPDLTHAILGVYTEAHELLDEMMFIDTDKNAVVGEVGDLLWYVALLLKTLDVSFEEVMEKNIEKLRKRYPERFTETLAMERNDEAA